MPKKFQSENTKAVVAKARKAEKAAEEKAQKEKAAEDALWKEDDKLICKKMQRKDDKEKKSAADLQKKKELKELEETEVNAIAPKTAPSKVTAYQIQKDKEEQEKLLASKDREDTLPVTEIPLEENLNRLDVDTISASGIDAAVVALSMNDDAPDIPSGKRMAAAFKAFENERLPQLQKENPTLKLSQLKQRLRKEWQRSCQNPLNQGIE